MDMLLKKTALPSIEDFAKDIIVKKNLTTELGKIIRTIQEENVGKSLILENESSNNLCSILEAIFIHGLKDKLTRKMSAVFGSYSEKIPDPQFWTVVSSYSHKNVITEIKSFTEITSDIGRGRAWLRLVLNDGLIISYVNNMILDNSNLQKYYNTTAYIRDEEQSDIMKHLLDGLTLYNFELHCDSSSLNVWNSTPLTLANLWSPPVTPQPVMPAVDVIDFFTDPKNQDKKAESSKSKKLVIISKGQSNQSQSDLPDKINNLEFQEEEISSNQELLPNINTETEDSDTKVASMEDNEFTFFESLKLSEEETSSKVSSDSVPDFSMEAVEHFEEESSSQMVIVGNKLNDQSGWSSTFDYDQDLSTYENYQSYDSLLQSYNKNLSKVIIGTPELADTFSSIMKKDEDYDEISSETKSPDLDFEIVPKYLAADHADEETKKLMDAIGKICHQQGLDSQNFECHSCGRPIGLIYGKARLCHYDGHSYCYECHINDEEIIPSKIIHNWDFKHYPVSKSAKSFLSQVVKDPLLDIKILNPELYTAIEEMAQMQLLRTQLTFLRSYIFTCKQSIAEELRKKLWPREYLFEHVHLYAIDDLLEISSGVLAQTLQKVITFAKKHVSSCQLCLLKGFICEVCNSASVIFPFDVESTYHCDKCLTVYHAKCMNANKYCPKCIRRMKRQQALQAEAD